MVLFLILHWVSLRITNDVMVSLCYNHGTYCDEIIVVLANSLFGLLVWLSEESVV